MSNSAYKNEYQYEGIQIGDLAVSVDSPHDYLYRVLATDVKKADRNDFVAVTYRKMANPKNNEGVVILAPGNLQVVFRGAKRPVPNTKFKVGDHVEWDRSYGGATKTKHGRIICVDREDSCPYVVLVMNEYKNEETYSITEKEMRPFTPDTYANLYVCAADELSERSWVDRCMLVHGAAGYTKEKIMKGRSDFLFDKGRKFYYVNTIKVPRGNE